MVYKNMKFPSITVYTENLPDDVGGYANAFFVRIREKYRNDDGIHRHEYEHVAQFWRMSIPSSLAIVFLLLVSEAPLEYMPIILAGFSFHSVLYKLIRPYRKYCEAKAYAAQVNSDGKDIGLMAHRLSLPCYDLKLTKINAKDEILRYMNQVKHTGR